MGIDAGIDLGVDEDAFTPTDAGPPDAFVIPPDELVIDPTDPPVTVPAGTTFTTLEYGPGDEQVMDAFVHLDAAEPTPVVVYVHGGGFTAGSRTDAYDGPRATELGTFLDAGVAYVSIDYRLLEPGSETEGVIKPMADVRRSVQWLRYFAEPLNLDPTRVALMGDGGGGGMSLWLAFHDEMANAASEEPIARESSRVSFAAVVGTQATYDALRWPTDVFGPFDVTADYFISQPPYAAQLLTVYGLPLTWSTMPERIEMALNRPEIEAYRAEVDMLGWMSADDPPFYARNVSENLAPDAEGFDLLEHPQHVRALADRATEVGIDATAEAPALSLGGEADAAQLVLDQLLP